MAGMAPNVGDTSGPSSPPPPLPEGWLPQWEGVQRKWYYVQRATGKSQWEIPTEPVALTPSTSPTPIGTGPSRAPALQPATNSHRVTGPRAAIPGGSYAATGMAGISSSFGSQDNPVHDPSRIMGWPSGPAAYGQHPGANEGSHLTDSLLSMPHGQPHPHLSAFQQSQDQAQNQPTAGQITPGQPWLEGLHHPGSDQGYQSSQALLYGPTPPHSHVPPYPWVAPLPTGTGAPIPQMHNPQSQWQSSQIPPLSSTQAHSGPTSVDPPFSGPGPGLKRQESHPVLGSYASCTSNSIMGQPPSVSGYPLSRSHSEHGPNGPPHIPLGFPNATHPPFSRYMPQPNLHGRFQGASLTQPGTVTSSHTAPTFQTGPQYSQNPLVQASINRYLPSQIQHPGGGTFVYTGTAQQHSTYPIPGDRPAGDSNQGPGNVLESSRTAASDPQFVSGPWASPSTPPTSG
ncbi:hypothetical protein N7510_000247 [Penicillium lagena]|uniref:uncharacterized protein n=1 Tax=Penicillium lagena TaxID=94218 RepID=UPI00253F843C|nr:uncharacterized protein N7510_000247 [Penicillium lagena]KAJ5623938.1 hypothetical protein N7510_000247 [Penicillium lagena]